MICGLYLKKAVFYFKVVSDTLKLGFPDGAVMVNPPTSAGDASSILELGRSSGGGNGNPLQYSCQENPLDKGAWWATVRVDAKELDTTY